VRILIVDDETPARERLKRLLAGIEGAELVGEAEGGVQAVEMIEALSPDLVLLDIQMPGLDGFGVIESLQDPPPVIFVTAYPVRRTLADLAARLDPAAFFRTHRSAIVNLNRVQKVIPWFKGSHKLRLTTGA